ncbi:hypothetical protein [Nonomuraea cavernae]|uniref:Uncharacterized protein n=1 Tax=Nonomuraea cavernae TaxID=2045107 RepID=A0A918DGD6_9ACTN|nr:hypothetical protein [Nonomuraea cavernae]MCA2184734.1 hypothetical protein [Nonomuraea cavernae]GGO62910.1 hypothetical protein GCM10012289_08580 [Nonomuraea cavernae]
MTFSTILAAGSLAAVAVIVVRQAWLALSRRPATRRRTPSGIVIEPHANPMPGATDSFGCDSSGGGN